MKLMQTLTTDYADGTDGESAASRRRHPNRREVLDCGGKSDATPLLDCATLLEIADTSARAKAPSRPTCRRTPRRFRDSLAPFLLCALLPGAVLLAGGAGAATLTVTNLADNGPGENLGTNSVTRTTSNP